ncbi:hypothetical protein ILYODFUR_035759 [Ilyodon furcidens]|uniref:Uncharacterized protein n=1 Tax=Ilyodon furcidens TaxID=33524 RepID=A0ABV0TQ10_9TELE
MCGPCWTTCLLNIGPYARCWTPLCLSNVIGHFVPQDSLSYNTQRPLRLIRRGRRSPEATVNYITEDGTTHHLPSAGDCDAVTTQLKHHLEKSPEWISFILLRWPTKNS